MEAQNSDLCRRMGRAYEENDTTLKLLENSVTIQRDTREVLTTGISRERVSFARQLAEVKKEKEELGRELKSAEAQRLCAMRIKEGDDEENAELRRTLIKVRRQVAEGSKDELTMKGHVADLSAALKQVSAQKEVAVEALAAVQQELTTTAAAAAQAQHEHASFLAGRTAMGNFLTLDHIVAHHVPDRDEPAHAPKGTGYRVQGKTNDKDVSDPFVKMTITDQAGGILAKKTTSVLKNQVHPEWPDSFTVWLPPGVAKPLTVSVSIWDKDKKGGELIAKTSVDLKGSNATVAKHPMPVHDSAELSIGFRHATSPPVFIDPPPKS